MSQTGLASPRPSDRLSVRQVVVQDAWISFPLHQVQATDWYQQADLTPRAIPSRYSKPIYVRAAFVRNKDRMRSKRSGMACEPLRRYFKSDAEACPVTVPPPPDVSPSGCREGTGPRRVPAAASPVCRRCRTPPPSLAFAVMAPRPPGQRGRAGGNLRNLYERVVHDLHRIQTGLTLESEPPWQT